MSCKRSDELRPEEEPLKLNRRPIFFFLSSFFSKEKKKMSAFVVHNPTKEMKRARLVGEENWFVSDRIVLFPLMDFLIQFHLSNLRFLLNSPTQPNPTPPILIFKQSHLTDTQENEGSRETRVNNGWPISGYNHAHKKKPLLSAASMFLTLRNSKPKIGQRIPRRRNIATRGWATMVIQLDCWMMKASPSGSQQAKKHKLWLFFVGSPPSPRAPERVLCVSLHPPLFLVTCVMCLCV